MPNLEGMTTTAETPLHETPLHTLLKESTATVHDEAENSSFMGDLLAGRSGRDAFVALTRQLWFVYSALEETVDALAEHPVIAPLHDEELRRLPALERDLDAIAPGWRDDNTPTPGTTAYVARLKECASDPVRLVAHHYTRYLGDLSGGQVIPRLLTRHYDITDGLDFYRFEGIAKPKTYKDAYRAALDALPLDAEEKQRAADEAVEAFRLNTAMFADLG